MQAADRSERPVMTFAQFQASRRWSDDLGATFGETDLFIASACAVGNVYAGAFAIESVPIGSPERARGAWSLLVERDWTVSGDLADLERRLYDWAVGEGYLDAAPWSASGDAGARPPVAVGAGMSIVGSAGAA